MKPTEFFIAIKQIIEEKKIPKDIIYQAIEQALVTAYKKKLGSAKDLKVIIDEEQKLIKVIWRRIVTEDGVLQRNGIPLSEALKIKPNTFVNDIIEVEISPEEIGRIAAQTVKQVVTQKLKEAEREILYNEYSKKIGHLVIGTIQKVDKKKIFISLGKVEGILPEKEVARREHLKIGNSIKVCVSEVRKDSKGIEVILTRSSNEFLSEIFRYYIPEINEGIVQIKGCVRDVGSRAKIAVYCSDKKIDPVGACVGLKGSRIKEINYEIGDEKIEIIRWDEDPAVFCANALAPAKVISVNPIEGERGFLVVVPDSQLSLAIGKDGQNVRLAAQLTKYRLDIKSESQYKEYLNKLIDKMTIDKSASTNNEELNVANQ